MTHSAQSRDSDFRARQPDYRLGEPGDVVVHAGPRQQPRIVSVPTCHAEHLIDLVEGDDLFGEVTGLLDSLDVSGLMVEFVNGEFGGIKYVYPAYGPDAEHPMSFTTESRVEGPTVVHHGSATVGTKDGVPFTHIHASWVAEDGTVSGGHLLAGTLVGPNGMRLRAFALTDARLFSEIDPESGFSAFAPAPFGAPLATEAESSGAPTAAGSAAETDWAVGVAPAEADSAVGVATAAAVPDHSVDAVVSRVRPGEFIDEAILAVCCEAGFDSAEVREPRQHHRCRIHGGNRPVAGRGVHPSHGHGELHPGWEPAGEARG